MGLNISDEVLGVVLPVAAYWVYSAMYEVAGLFVLGKYRIYPREDEDEKNLVTRWEVAKGVLFNQAFQTALSGIFFWLQSRQRSGALEVQPPLHVQAVQLLVAILVVDVWQYFSHRLFHTNRFLYKHLHARHHHIVVPYAFGAQYQHLLEALVMDSLGVVVAAMVACMTTRTTAFFLTLTALKVIDDHCGFWLWGHPFHLVFSNNSAFHTVHHQLYGGKANFSAPYFTFWDKIMVTYMPYSTVEKREEGGYELKPLKGAAEKED